MLLKNWAYALLLVFLIGAMTQQPWPVAFSVAAVIVFMVTLNWRRHALDGVRYRRQWVYRRGFTGERLTVQIEVDNNKILPVSWLQVVDTWPHAIGPEDETILGPSHSAEIGELVNLYSLRWYQQVKRSYSLLLRSRGLYLLGPARLTSGDLFGMYDIQQTAADEDRVVVFPEILPVQALQLPRQDPFGDRRSVRRLFEDPCQTYLIRPYQPGDGFRKIHWQATARSGEIQVRVYQPVSTRVMMICLNVSTQIKFWLGINQDRLEELVKVTATLAYQGIQDGYAVGLLSNGCMAHSDRPFQIAPGRSTEHLAQLLTALAAVTPFTMAPFENYLAQSMPRIPFGASLVIVTSLVSPALSASLLRLERYRTHTTLLMLSDETAPVIPGVRVVQLSLPPS